MSSRNARDSTDRSRNGSSESRAAPRDATRKRFTEGAKLQSPRVLSLAMHEARDTAPGSVHSRTSWPGAE
jgi:hypothetical protein